MCFPAVSLVYFFSLMPRSVLLTLTNELLPYPLHIGLSSVSSPSPLLLLFTPSLRVASVPPRCFPPPLYHVASPHLHLLVGSHAPPVSAPPPLPPVPAPCLPPARSRVLTPQQPVAPPSARVTLSPALQLHSATTHSTPHSNHPDYTIQH